MARKTKKAKSSRESSERDVEPRVRHAFWSGTISFGLVSIPVSLFSTVHSSKSSLRMLSPDGSPLERKYYCPEDDHDVHPEHIQRGYELENGEYVIVTDEELESVEPRKSHVIDLKQFVERSEISPAYFERAYVLTPSGDSPKPYHLLAGAMEETGRAGIATFVMRDREYLVAILAEGGILRAQTMRFHDELRKPADVGLEEPESVDKQQVAKFKKIISNHHEKKIALSELKDQRGERLRELAEAKRKRDEGVIRIEEEVADQAETEDGEAPEVDLLEAIRQSLQGKASAAPARKRRAESRRGDRDTDNPSRQTLLSRAKRLHISGSTSMTKQELTRAIRKATG